MERRGRERASEHTLLKLGKQKNNKSTFTNDVE
jgi:hypothetical protein